MVHEMNKPTFEADEQLEFDFYLEWEWPDHIETALRRLLWISLIEEAEPGISNRQHTAFLRWLIATHPDSPAAVLDFLATGNDAELTTRVAENKQTWPVTLSRLSKSEHADVRAAVAGNSNTPIDALLSLSQDECLDVRYSMAENPTLPSKILQQLSVDDNPYVSTRAARTMARRNPAAIGQLPRRQERKLG